VTRAAGPAAMRAPPRAVVPPAMRAMITTMGVRAPAGAYAAHIGMEVEVIGLNGTLAGLKVLLPLAKAGLCAGIRLMGEDCAKILKMRYMSWGAPAAGTQKKRAFEGFPATPLASETGAMVKSIAMTVDAPDRVRISMPAEHAGKALVFEEGRFLRIVPTKKSWYYLGLILGFNPLSRPPPYIFVVIPPRPTWGPTVLHVYGQASKYLYPPLRRALGSLPGFSVVG